MKIIGNPYRLKLGKNFKIWENSILSVNKGWILIGDNGLIGIGSIINAGNNIIKIGNGVAIASHCSIFAYSHHYYEDVPILNSYLEKDVLIEDDVLIGANVVILPGVTIHKGAIIAASSVVNKDVPPYTIVGGNPISIIKKREK